LGEGGPGSGRHPEYHGTRVSSAKSILKQGIKPGIQTKLGDESPGVFTTEDKAMALSYARGRATEEFGDLPKDRHAALVILKNTDTVKGQIPPSSVSHIEVYKVSDIKKMEDSGGKVPKPIKILRKETTREAGHISPKDEEGYVDSRYSGLKNESESRKRPRVRESNRHRFPREAEVDLQEFYTKPGRQQGWRGGVAFSPVMLERPAAESTGNFTLKEF
jgi:hypothetical protein